MENKINTILSFKIKDNIFAVDALQVIHILEVPDIITKVPNTPAYMTGVINHHGNIIPVVDMRTIMEEKREQKGKEHSIIIINLFNGQDVKFGIYVDMICEVIELKEGDLKETVLDNKKGMIDSYEGTILHKGDFIHIINLKHLSEIIDK